MACNRLRLSFPARHNDVGGGNFRNPKRGVPQVFRKFPTALPCIMEPRRKTIPAKRCVGCFRLFLRRGMSAAMPSLHLGGGMRKHAPLRVVVYIFRRLVCGEFQRQRVCRDGVAGGIPRCSVSLTASHERRHVVRHGGTVMRYRMWRHFRDVACHGRPKRISGVSVRYWPIPF